MRLNRIAFLATVALVAVVPRIALAGDMPTAYPMATPPPMAAGAYNWTGSYIGAQGGYGWSNIDVGTTRMYNDADGADEFAGSPLDPFSYNGSGLVGGGEVGYNWQTNSLVFGLVADISAADIHGSFTNDDLGFTSETTINWLSTFRGNIGVPMDRLLFYATGGLAVGGIQADLADDYGTDGIYPSSDSVTAVGWTAGAGVAAALGNNWIVKAEYLYVDLGHNDVSFAEDPTGAVGFPVINSSADVTASLLRFSLDYKF